MRYVLCLASFCLLALIATEPSFAHSKVAKSKPAEGATVKPGLAEITLGFTMAVRLMTVKVRNMGAKADVKASLKPAHAYAASFSFPVEPLGKGDHSVLWTAVAEDGHVMNGALKFTVGD